METRKLASSVFDLKMLNRPLHCNAEPEPGLSTYSPFSSFPTELISLIFTFAIARNPAHTGLWEPVKRVRPLVSITNVSKQWYRVAINTPELWSTLIITSHRWFPSEAVTLWLDRAKNTKLDVHLLSDNPHVPRLQLDTWRTVITSKSVNIRSLSVILGAAEWARVKPLLPSALPSLVAASIYIIESMSPAVQAGSEPDMIPLEAPRLQNFVTNSVAAIDLAMCPALEELEITRLDEGSNDITAIWDKIRSMVGNMPVLKRLKISSRRQCLVPTSMSRLDLLHLESLHLDVKGRFASTEALSRICAPKLKDLTILGFSAEAPPPETYPVISLPSLRSIRLTHTTLRQTGWLLDHLSYGDSTPSTSKLKVTVEMDVRRGKEEAGNYDLKMRLRQKYSLGIKWTSGI